MFAAQVQLVFETLNMAVPLPSARVAPCEQPATPVRNSRSNSLASSPASWSAASSAGSPAANPDGATIFDILGAVTEDAVAAAPKKKQKSTKVNEKRLNAEMQKAEQAIAAQRHAQDTARVNEAVKKSMMLPNKLLMQMVKEEKKALAKSAYHRNATKVMHIPVYSRVRGLETACNKIKGCQVRR